MLEWSGYFTGMALVVMACIVMAVPDRREADAADGPDDSGAAQSATALVTATGATLQKLAGGFAFTEGPSCDAHGNVFFTDQPNDRIMEWSVDGKLSTFMQPCGRSNGTCFDSQGNLVACADENRQLWSIDPQKKVTVLIKDYQGQLLNGPNDVWIRPDGGLYITDPYYRRDYWKDAEKHIEKECVYYLPPEGKAGGAVSLTPGVAIAVPAPRNLLRVVDDMKRPNGIIGTPDGKILYVSDIDGGQTWSYEIHADGTLGNKKLICKMGSDGMTIDSEGNIYLSNHGVTIFDKTGRQIQHIDIKENWTGNVCFGGADRQTLFITASKGLYAIRMRVHGVGSQ